MPKICCIINCHDKSNSVSDQRKLFVIPKDEERRRKWLDVISPHLREGRKVRKLLYVCDLHFKDDDILRNTSILLKDGSTDMISCLQVKLKSSSIPCIFDGKHRDSPTIDFHTVNIETISLPTSEDTEEPEVALKENIRTEVIHPVRIKKLTDLVIHQELEPIYDLNMLEKDLNSLWEKRKNYVWVSFKMRCGIMLSYFGHNPRVATKTILVKEDMSTEIRASGEIYMTDFKEKIKSVDDVVSLMTEVQQNHRCPGIDSSTQCPYDYFKLPTILRSERCGSCQIARKQQLNNLSRFKKRSESKANKTKQLIRNLKLRNERLVKNLAAAKENIELLKVQCASASEVAIAKATKHLSSVQQEAVKACLTAAQCKGPTGVRYSQPWILECIMLLVKNRQAYLHLLSNQILQVPTIETLNKYLKKMKPSHGLDAETVDILRAKVAEITREEGQE